jgi:hypothetical protein
LPGMIQKHHRLHLPSNSASASTTAPVNVASLRYMDATRRSSQCQALAETKSSEIHSRTSPSGKQGTTQTMISTLGGLLAPTTSRRNGHYTRPSTEPAVQAAGCSCPSCHDFFTVLANGSPKRFQSAVQQFSRHHRTRIRSTSRKTIPPPTPRFWRKIEFSSPETSPNANAQGRESAPTQSICKL